MQIKLIKKNTSTGRVEFYDPANVLLGSVPATSPMRVGNNTVDFDSVGDRVFSVGYNVDFTTTQIGAGAITPAPATFALFLTLLQTSFFNATNAGGSGGGGGGDASAANQELQLARQGTTTDSPATNPNGAATEISLQKGIFGNGLKFKSLELVIEEGTGIEYYRAVDVDPNTPPATIIYIDPLTGSVTTAPSNPAYPVLRTLPPNAIQQEARLGDLRGQSSFNFGQNFRYAKIVRAVHADLSIAAQALTIDVLGTTYDLWDGETYELPLLPYPNFYDLGNLSITKGGDIIASITYINA